MEIGKRKKKGKEAQSSFNSQWVMRVARRKTSLDECIISRSISAELAYASTYAQLRNIADRCGRQRGERFCIA